MSQERWSVSRVSFPADDVACGSSASLPGMIFAISHLANIINLLKWCDEQSGHNCFHTLLYSQIS